MNQNDLDYYNKQYELELYNYTPKPGERVRVMGEVMYPNTSKYRDWDKLKYRGQEADVVEPWRKTSWCCLELPDGERAEAEPRHLRPIRKNRWKLHEWFDLEDGEKDTKEIQRFSVLAGIAVGFIFMITLWNFAWNKWDSQEYGFTLGFFSFGAGFLGMAVGVLVFCLLTIYLMEWKVDFDNFFNRDPISMASMWVVLCGAAGLLFTVIPLCFEDSGWFFLFLPAACYLIKVFRV